MTEEGFPVHSAAATLIRTALAFRDPIGHLRSLAPVREHVSVCLPISGIDLATAFHCVNSLGERYEDVRGTHQGQLLSNQYASQFENFRSILGVCLSRPLDVEPVQSTRAAWLLCRMLTTEVSEESLRKLSLEAARVAEEHDLEHQKALLLLKTEADVGVLATFVQVFKDSGDLDSFVQGLETRGMILFYGLNQRDRAFETFEEGFSVLGDASISEASSLNFSASYAKILRSHDPVKASQILREALPVAEAGLYIQVQARIHQALADTERRRGHFSKAHFHTQTALNFHTHPGLSVAISLSTLLSLLVMEGQFGEAEKVGFLSYEILHQLDRMSDWGASVLQTIITLFVSQERLSEAAPLLKQFLQVIRLGPVDPLVVSLLFELSCNNLDKAQEFASEIMTIRRRARADSGDRFRVLKGELFWRKGAFQDALTEFSVLLVIACKTGYRLGVSMILLRLGDIYRVGDRDMETARSCYVASLELIKHMGVPRHQADSVVRIAASQAYFREMELSRSNLSRVKGLFELTSCPSGVQLCDRYQALSDEEYLDNIHQSYLGIELTQSYLLRSLVGRTFSGGLVRQWHFLTRLEYTYFFLLIYI